MFQFIKWFRDAFFTVTDMLDSVIFDIDGIKVSLFSIMLGFMVLGFAISAFWKGGRT